MADIKKVAALTEKVERVITEDVETRPEGFELFLTRAEAEGLRTFLGLGTTSKTLVNLGIEDVWERLYDAVGVRVNCDYTFTQVAKLEQ